MPEPRSISSSLLSSPGREDAQSDVEGDPWSASLLTADVPGVRRVDLRGGCGARSGLDVELDDSEGDVEGRGVECRGRVEVGEDLSACEIGGSVVFTSRSATDEEV